MYKPSKPLVSQKTNQGNQTKRGSNPPPRERTVKGLGWQQLICISPFSSHPDSSNPHINATPTRRLLEPSRDDSRRSVQEGLASCFVSDRCSWPTV